ACRLRAGLNVQIAPMPYGSQKGSRRAHTESLVYRPLKITYAFLRCAVIVFGTRHAVFDSTVDERFANGVHPVDIADGQLATATAVGFIAPTALLHGFEVRQHIRRGPPRVAQRRPFIVIRCLPSVVNQTIDGS